MADFPLGVEHLQFVTIRWASSLSHKICRNAAGAIVASDSAGCVAATPQSPAR
jgi:hypothetical protein